MLFPSGCLAIWLYFKHCGYSCRGCLQRRCCRSCMKSDVGAGCKEYLGRGTLLQRRIARFQVPLYRTLGHLMLGHLTGNLTIIGIQASRRMHPSVCSAGWCFLLLLTWLLSFQPIPCGCVHPFSAVSWSRSETLHLALYEM